jgi:hypothetical protein
LRGALAQAFRRSLRLAGGRATLTLYCSFCGKSQHEVAKLVAGPSLFICNECTDLCQRDRASRRAAVSALAVALALTVSSALGAWAQPPQPREPYSCRLLYDEQRKCSFNPHCDKRAVKRLRKECLSDGGRP